VRQLPRWPKTSFGERHAGEFFLETLPLGGVGGFGKAIGELEEPLVLGFLGLQANFYQIDKNAAGAGLLVLGKSENALGDTCRERNALAHRTVNATHAPIVQRPVGRAEAVRRPRVTSSILGLTEDLLGTYLGHWAGLVLR
jgi:hypothetical protein